MSPSQASRDMTMRFLSHDLHASQAAILALVEQMQQDPPRFTVTEFVSLVEHYATTALSLADDFMLLAWAERAPSRKTELDVALVLGDAIDDMWPQASARSITISLIAEPGKYIIADVQLLRRAFANLIGNAIKFSPRGSSVQAKLEDVDRHVRVSIIDNGVGIEQHKIKELLREFHRLNERSPGYGLGLAFVKMVIDSLNGVLEIESEPNRGAIFTVWLPKDLSTINRISNNL